MDTRYVLLGFPLGIITVTLSLTGFGLGLGLAVIWIGLPLTVATLVMARGFATLERARIGPVLGRRLPHPYYKKRPEGSRLRRTLP